MLDPQRIGLNAETVGFLKRTKQEVDWHAFEHALQTEYNNQNSAVDVRREIEATNRAFSEGFIHVMGGQINGREGNDLQNTLERQQRQINGYPLRQFSSSSPAVILPKKYGGFPIYTGNAVEYPELVSVFCEPMSAPLQRDTELLGRQGAVALSNSLNEPYSPDGFINPMNHSYNALVQNEGVFKQRKHLQNMSDRSKKLKPEEFTPGIFVSSNGEPMSGVAEEIRDNIAQQNFSQVGDFAHQIEFYNQKQLEHQQHLTHRQLADDEAIYQTFDKAGPLYSAFTTARRPREDYVGKKKGESIKNAAARQQASRDLMLQYDEEKGAEDLAFYNTRMGMIEGLKKHTTKLAKYAMMARKFHAAKAHGGVAYVKGGGGGI